MENSVYVDAMKTLQRLRIECYRESNMAGHDILCRIQNRLTQLQTAFLMAVSQ